MYTIHSWLRYPILVLGLLGLAFAIWGMLTRKAYEKRMWDLAFAFTLSLYLEIVVGFLLIFSTTNRFFDRTLGLHMVMTMVAVAVSQMTYSANRRRPREKRQYAIHVWGIGLALALVVTSILVIRDSVFG